MVKKRDYEFFARYEEFAGGNSFKNQMDLVARNNLPMMWFVFDPGKVVGFSKKQIRDLILSLQSLKVFTICLSVGYDCIEPCLELLGLNYDVLYYPKEWDHCEPEFRRLIGNLASGGRGYISLRKSYTGLCLYVYSMEGKLLLKLGGVSTRDRRCKAEMSQDTYNLFIRVNEHLEKRFKHITLIPDKENKNTYLIEKLNTV